MTTWDKAYRKLGIINAVIHFSLLLLILTACFLPFRDDLHFFQIFTGYFGDTAAALHPYLILLLYVAACAFSVASVKWPVCSLAVFCLAFLFFLLVFLPYVIEAAVFGLASPWLGAPEIPRPQIGYTLINHASNGIFLDILFTVYSMITVFLRIKNRTASPGLSEKR